MASFHLAGMRPVELRPRSALRAPRSSSCGRDAALRWRRRRRGRRARRSPRRPRPCAPGRAWRAGRARSSKAASAAVRERDRLLDLEVLRDAVSLTPRPYSTGTRAMKRSSCWARRAGSSAVKGAAVKPSSAGRSRPACAAAWPVAAASGGAAARANAAWWPARRPRRGPAGIAARGSASSRRPARRPRPRRRRSPLARGVGVVEQLTQARLVGVEQVLRDAPARARGGRSCRARARAARGVASTPGRVKRVAVRKSRSSSQARGARRRRGRGGERHRVGAAVAARARTSPRAAASATASPRARRARPRASARRSARSAPGASRAAPARARRVGRAGRARSARRRRRRPRISSVCASNSAAGPPPRPHGASRRPVRRRRRRGAARRTTPGDGAAADRRSSSRARCPSCSAACVTWPAIASAWSCASAPSVSASSAVNFLPPASWSRRRAAKASSSVSDCAGLGGLLRSAFAIVRLDVGVDQLEPAEDVGDVLQARGADERPSRSPCHRPRSVSSSMPRSTRDIVGVMTTSAVSASCSVGFHAWRRRRAPWPACRTRSSAAR